MVQTRRTQAERTAATRAALLAATVDALVENGYRRSSPQVIATRAGVSYGALLHHYPTKADLFTAAVQHLLELREAEFRKAMADLPPDTPKAQGAIDVLWTMFQGPAFTAWLEMRVAARTEAEFRVAVAAVDELFLETSVEIFRELFVAESAAEPDLPRLAVGILFTFLDGLALSRLIPTQQPTDSDELLAVFTSIITAALPTPSEEMS